MTLLELLSELHDIYRNNGNIIVVNRNFSDLGDSEYLLEKDRLVVENETLFIE